MQSHIIDMFLYPLSLVFFLSMSTSIADAALPPIHYTISRRGGSFPKPDTANLTYLLEQLSIVEQRLGATTRTFSGNKVVRKPKRLHGTQAGTTLLGEAGRGGNWFASLQIGEPIQEIDMDLDMLTADWWILSTSSNKGSFYLDFKSSAYSCANDWRGMASTDLEIVDSESPLAFPTCRQPKDIFHLPTVHRSVPISFAHCRPSKQWSRSLMPSGAYFGLAPSTALSQTKTPSLMPQLIEKQIIDTPLWSILLINGNDGIFSLGGTSVESVKEVERETADDLERIGGHQNNERASSINDRASRKAGDDPNDWKWIKVQGAEGWWQILMRGIWIDEIKVLENQAVILDINTPFIIAPRLAARTFYSSISGSKQLPSPYDQFHAYPCFNPPRINFDFANWKIEVLKGKRDHGTFSSGGRFSLGRMTTGSGYCIGVVVESRMGISTSDTRESTFGIHMDGGDGLSDVWVIGEPFFRDAQIAFNWRDKLVGIQRA